MSFPIFQYSGATANLLTIIERIHEIPLADYKKYQLSYREEECLFYPPALSLAGKVHLEVFAAAAGSPKNRRTFLWAMVGQPILSRQWFFLWASLFLIGALLLSLHLRGAELFLSIPFLVILYQLIYQIRLYRFLLTASKWLAAANRPEKIS